VRVLKPWSASTVRNQTSGRAAAARPARERRTWISHGRGAVLSWRVRYTLREGMQWLVPLLAVHDGKTTSERIEALYVLSALSGRHGDPEAAAR
jgi:hypothetical protein